MRKLGWPDWWPHSSRRKQIPHTKRFAVWWVSITHKASLRYVFLQTRQCLALSKWWASSRWLTILSHYYDRQISLRPPGWWDLNTPTPGGTLPKFSKASFMWIFMFASCVPQSWHGKNHDNESKGVTCISAFSHAFENIGSEGANGIHTWTLLQWREGVYDRLCTMFRKM